MNNEFQNSGKYTDEVKNIVDDWISKVLTPIKNINHRRTGYGLKHRLQSDTGVYLFNEEFARAMNENGFRSQPCGRGQSAGENDSFFNIGYRLKRYLK